MKLFFIGVVPLDAQSASSVLVNKKEIDGHCPTV